MITATHLHAMIIHFPIALLMAGFLSEVIALFAKKEFFRNASFYLLLLGAIGATAAYITGSSAGEGIEDGPLMAPMDQHQQTATITLWIAIITASFRVIIFYFKYDRKWTRLLAIVLFTILAGAVSRTGYLGGQLVYSHGAGVELALPDFGNLSGEK